MKGFSHILLLILVSAIGGVLLFNLGSSASSGNKIISPQAEKAISVEPKTATSGAQTKENLQKYLTVEAALLGVSDNVSVYFKDLSSNTEVSIDPTRSWIPASTIKAYVVLEAFRQRSLGLIDFNQKVTIKANNVVPTELETDEFPRLREGTQTTIKQLVEAMIIQSDNTAYNTLLDVLDRRNISLALKNIGITETVVGEKLNLDDSQFQEDLKVPGRQPNTTTVKDLATFFDLLYNKKIGSADEILGIFKRQKINDMIPALLPPDTEVAHKTGDWAPIYHDGGVVYKPQEPFILTIFSNSDDPKIVARLAEVAYFQNAASVGKLSAFNSPQQQFAGSSSRIYLTQLPDQAVLAAETPEKFPEVSASDLGITQKDLNVNPTLAKDFLGAIITPGSLLYNLKKFFEDKSLQNAKDDTSKVQTLVGLSKNRLSEAKSLIGSGDFKGADDVLKQSEADLEQATNLAKNDSNKDLLMLEVKRANDLHYSVLAERAEHLNDSQKEQFINDVYNFYQQNHQKVAPIINTSVAANPTQQKPAVGTITEVKNGQAKIQFDDGSSKEIILASDTKVRNFQETDYTDIKQVKTGDTVAVVGLTNSQSQIIPQFILKNVPKELPQRHQGTIIEIKPDENTIKILDKKGQEEIININFNTTIKAKDTNVSLEGIKAGSEITVFGTVQSTPATSATPIDSLLSPSPFQSTTPSQEGNSIPGSLSIPASAGKTIQLNTPTPPQPGKVSTGGNVAQPNKPASNNPAPAPISVKATSVTVTQNSSGKQEKVEANPAPPQPPAPKQEAPKKEEPKKEEPKKPSDKK